MVKFLFLILLLVSSISQASSLHSLCHLNSAINPAIQGYQTELKLPIASVSKLFTSYWALLALGKEYRFVTTFFYRQNSDRSFDVHIQGGADPYFTKESLHFLASELNRLGIKSVRRFSFDENFKFHRYATSSLTAMSDYKLESPTPQDVLVQLQKIKNLTWDYGKTWEGAKNQGIEMVPSIDLSVKSYEIIKRTEFNSQDFRSVSIKSAFLPKILKEMNRNSNNYSANIIFEFLGGAKKFNSFIQRRLNYTFEDIEFYNGSGDRFEVGDQRFYNSAKCSVIIRTIVDFENVLHSLCLKFEDIVSVVGADSTSVASTLYKNEVTEKVVVANTGTVDPAIVLAGIIFTKKGEVYFMFNMKTNGTRRDWQDAQLRIKKQVTVLIQEIYDGGVPIPYEATKFFPFEN